MNKSLFVAVALFSGLSVQAEKAVYQVTASGESGIDLTALGDGYYQDRFAGPSASGEVHVTGEVKYVLEPGGALGIIAQGTDKGYSSTNTVGNLRLWQTGLFDANHAPKVPLTVSGTGGDIDFYDETCILGSDWNEKLVLADCATCLRFDTLIVTGPAGTPFSFDPRCNIRVATATWLGCDGGDVTVNVKSDRYFHTCNVYGTTLHGHRSTPLYLGGIRTSGSAPGYATLNVNGNSSLGYIHFSEGVTAAKSTQAQTGRTNVLSLAGTAYVPNLTRSGPDSVLIRFNGQNAHLDQPGWHASMFNKSNDNDNRGRYVLESVDGGKIVVRISKGVIGDSSVVEFRGDGEVVLECGDSQTTDSKTGLKYSANAKLSNPDGTKILWNQKGKLLLKCSWSNTKGGLFVADANAFPYGAGKCDVEIQENLDVRVAGTDQRFNSLSGGGKIYNSTDNEPTFTVGEHGGDCVFDVTSPTEPVCMYDDNQSNVLSFDNHGFALKKVGAGTMEMRKPLFAGKPLTVDAGKVMVTADVDLSQSAVILAADTELGVEGATLTLGTVVAAETAKFRAGPGGTLVYDPSKATFDLSTLTGNGTIEFVSDVTLTGVASDFHGTVRVTSGTVTVADADAFADDTVCFSVGASGTLSLPSGMNVAVGNLEVRGATLSPGVCYGGTAAEGVTVLAGLAGAGTVYFRAVEATWTAGGGADTSVLNPANWSSGTVPGLYAGNLTATFAAAGAKATFPNREVRIKKLVFTAGRPDFTFEPSGAGSVISLGAGGIAVAVPTAGTFHFTNGVRLAVNGSQTWTAPASTRITLTAPLVDDPDGTVGKITKSDFGELYAFSSNSTFTGDLVLSNGVTYAYGKEPFGPSGRIDIWDAVGQASLHYVKVDSSKNVFQHDSYDNDKTWKRRGLYVEDGDTVQRGVYNCSTCTRFVIGSGHTLYCLGGLVVNYFNGVDNGGSLVVSNSVFSTSAWEGGGDLTLAHPQNSIAKASSCSTKVTLAADRAVWMDSNFFVLKGSNSRIDLCGFENRFCNLQVTENGTLTSSRPGGRLQAMMTDSNYSEWLGKVTGDVTIVKSGAADLLLAGQITSTGSPEVLQGRLEVASGSSWTAATNLVVDAAIDGSAKLAINASGCFSRKATLRLDNGGKFVLGGSSTVQRVRELFVDGQPMPAGRYSRAGGNGTTKLDNLEGDGVLDVTGTGLYLLVR